MISLANLHTGRMSKNRPKIGSPIRRYTVRFLVICVRFAPILWREKQKIGKCFFSDKKSAYLFLNQKCRFLNQNTQI